MPEKPKRATTEKRHAEVITFINHRYAVDRIRYDDVLLEACDKFFYSLGQIQKIVKQG